MVSIKKIRRTGIWGLRWPLLVGIVVFSGGCTKSSFLDKVPSTQLVVPTTLADFQTLLDNEGVMQNTTELPEVSSDNYYMTYPYWLSCTPVIHNAYIWAPDVFGSQPQQQDWDNPYKEVFYANVVLEGLSNVVVNGVNEQQWNMEKGAALFIRAFAFYNLAQEFAPAYDAGSATQDLGIPLRLSPDINIKTVRSSVQATYDQIFSDLKQAAELLPDTIAFYHRNRPTRPAVLALMARASLSMRNYPMARSYADSSLRLYDSLIDYNTLSKTSSFPFSESNAEVLYQSVLNTSALFIYGIFNNNLLVDSSLFASYAPADLRHVVFYKISAATGKPSLKGSYNGKAFAFGGIATDEMYLVRAEGAARAGDGASALQDLNMLLSKRYAKGSFSPVTASSPEAALDSVLVERRKELAFRGLRWTDLRRLNKEGAGIVLTRQLNGQLYTLPPLDPRYVLPIPPDVISLSGIQQNAR